MLAHPRAGKVAGMDMAHTVTAEHEHDELSEDRGLAPSYVVPNSWEHARRRLELLEACYDAASFQRASSVGVREGWRCLDAGAGHGSFARWLGSKVGAAGSVLAVDLDTRLLAGATEPNIEVRQMDLVSGQLPDGKFDFVHTRMVLTHIPAREQVLGRLCAALRPGGIVMIEDLDAFPVLATATGAYRQAWLAFIRACRAAGLDTDWARDLPLRLHRHGLIGIDAELDVPLFRGGSAHAQFWSLTWQQVRDRVVAVGEPAHVIDQGQADLGDQQRWFHGPAMVAAWGRRPPI
jgi:2-polyprenyl-3-methyl-5-hydroxy-6-metoxy-1,4-benzoquinol methylase